LHSSSTSADPTVRFDLESFDIARLILDGLLSLSLIGPQKDCNPVTIQNVGVQPAAATNRDGDGVIVCDRKVLRP
jgi:hypothetical protein